MENGVFFSFKLSISVYLYWEDEKKKTFRVSYVAAAEPSRPIFEENLP